MNINFKDNLRRFISEANITQKAFAESIGCTQETLSAYVRGIGLPRIERTCKIADYFNISLDKLVLNRNVPRNNDRKIRIKENIEYLKKESGLSIEKLANKAGLSWQNVYRLAEHQPRIDTLALLAEALGVSIEDLAYGVFKVQKKISLEIAEEITAKLEKLKERPCWEKGTYDDAIDEAYDIIWSYREDE